PGNLARQQPDFERLRPILIPETVGGGDHVLLFGVPGPYEFVAAFIHSEKVPAIKDSYLVARSVDSAFSPLPLSHVYVDRPPRRLAVKRRAEGLRDLELLMCA